MRIFMASVLLANTAIVSPALFAQETQSGIPAGKADDATPQKPQFGSFGLDVTAMDPSVKPGDAFYEYANGTWLANVKIPADKATVGVGHQLADLSSERVRKILDAVKDDPANIAGRVYSTYLDEAAVESRGLTPIKPWLDKIGGLSDRRGYSALLVEAADMGVSGPFTGFVWFDSKDPDAAIYTIMQSGTGIPAREIYLGDNPAFVKIREQYVDHLARMLTLAGEANGKARAQAVMALETEIAGVLWTAADSANPVKIYNKYTTAQTAEFSSPTVDLPAILAAISPKITDVIIWQPSALKGMAAIMDKAPLSVLKDQLALRSLGAYADVLPHAIAKESFSFYGAVLAGTPEQEPRWKRGVTHTEAVVSDVVGKEYVARYFPPEYKEEMNKLVANMSDALADRIDKLGWMQPETKKRAKAKLRNFIVKVGYPDQWRDYTGLVIEPGDLYGNTIRVARFNQQYTLNKLGKPFPRWEWIMPPQAINAYANFGTMEVVFMAGMLQPPVFDPKADPAINYGAIGVIVAHEISHHFDNRGAAYNENGILSDWWTPEDLAGFEAAGKVLIDQYNAYEPLPGHHINGAFALSENTGDLAGLAIAYDAYQKSLGGKPAPVIDGFTGDQRFFLGWAQTFRSKQRDSSLQQKLLTDPHSPAKYRVLNVRNLDAWHKAFNVKPGDKLYLDPSKRAKIW